MIKKRIHSIVGVTRLCIEDIASIVAQTILDYGTQMTRLNLDVNLGSLIFETVEVKQNGKRN